MRKSTVHQIHRFWPQDRIKRVVTATKRTKTAITTREDTAAIFWTEATAEERIAAAVRIATTTKTAAAMKTMVTVAKAPKIFKKMAIIATGEETTTVAARTSKKSGAISFDKGEKYI